MAYLHIVDQRGHSMDDFRAVSAELGAVPAGVIAVGAGPTGEGIRVVSLWRSKQDADRFAAEQLGPAMARVFAGRPLAPKITELELEELSFPSAACAVPDAQASAR